MRQRLAPSAKRVAISSRRSSVRASCMCATLTQAISSTQPTAPHSVSRARETEAVVSSRAETTRTPMPALVSGYSAAAPAAMRSISACAWVIVTPGRKRPTTSIRRASRLLASAGLNRSTRIHSSMGGNAWIGNRKPAGMTATTTTPSPSSVIWRPTTPGSAANVRCHSAWLSTTLGGCPGAAATSALVPSSGRASRQ
jgi:hypothetical protein